MKKRKKKIKLYDTLIVYEIIFLYMEKCSDQYILRIVK